MLAILPPVLKAQVAPAAPPNAVAQPQPTGEVVELSPFTVQTDRDLGYQAENTLAGSRLNTQLRDTASSISVFTQEFLDDTAITDISELLRYTVNAEMNTNENQSVSDQNPIVNAQSLTPTILNRGLTVDVTPDLAHRRQREPAMRPHGHRHEDPLLVVEIPVAPAAVLLVQRRDRHRHLVLDQHLVPVDLRAVAVRANSWLAFAGRPYNNVPNNPNNRITVRNYLTEGNYGTYRVGDYRQLPRTIAFDGRDYGLVFANEVAGANNSGGEQESTSVLGVIQSYFLDNKLVTTFGYRQDEVDVIELGYYNDPVKGDIVDRDRSKAQTTGATGYTGRRGWCTMCGRGSRSSRTTRRIKACRRLCGRRFPPDRSHRRRRARARITG